MSNQQALTGGADAQHILSNQVDLFLFDLKNEATEHGFKPNDTWHIQVATDQEAVVLKKAHQPFITLRLQAHALLKGFQQVKSQLKQSLSVDDLALTANDLINNEKTLLVAFPGDNPRQ